MLGEQRQTVELTMNGVVGDRAYAVIDRSDGKVASAKNPRKWRALLSCRAEFVSEFHPGDVPPPVRMTFPDGSDVRSDAPDIDAQLSKFLDRDVSLATAAPQGATFEA